MVWGEACVGKVQGVGSNLDPQMCVIESERPDLQSLCSASADVGAYGSETWPLMKMEDMQRL